ncbi:MAG: glycerate kinase [Cyanobacteria bacterium REEB67]|nr:glycerate kinase [Cyanobacteria bacterium REEB67]
MTKILVAPASYKGSVSASVLAATIGQACRDYAAVSGGALIVQEAPIADGGDDSLACLHAALGGDLVSMEVVGPVGLPVPAAYLRLADMAVVELACASGIAYLNARTLAPLTSHTYGTGQLIAAAIAGGARKIIITVGGSASTDGGTGALVALGAKFLDKDGRALELGGGALLSLAAIDLSALHACCNGVDFTVATDVVSPLLGRQGAATVFGPQKGANAAEVAWLDQSLSRLAEVFEASCGIDASRRDLPGAGAAGGAGYGFACSLPARIVSGFHLFADLLALREKVSWCDLLIVAEGKLDEQSLSGKGVGEIIALAAAAGKGILALPAVSELDSAALAAIFGLPASARLVVAPTASLSSTGVAGLNQVAAMTKSSLSQLLAHL